MVTGGYMKKLSFLLILFLLLSFGAQKNAHAAVAVSAGFNTGDFGFLANYGSWVTVRNYGTVWRPHVIAGWRPFTYGHWIMTDNGWTWVSYEPYGWAVYHYGNWNYDPGVGWVWVPGNEWSPARVSWVTYGDYVGWAPLPSAGVVLPDPWAVARVHYWNVIPVRSFTVEEVNHVMLRSAPLRPAVSVTVVRRGPDVPVIERVVNRRIDVVHVNMVNVPAGKWTLRRIEFPAAVAARVDVHRHVVERDVIRVHHENAVEHKHKTVVVHKKHPH
jgi:hypothetical protein